MSNTLSPRTRAAAAIGWDAAVDSLRRGIHPELEVVLTYNPYSDTRTTFAPLPLDGPVNVPAEPDAGPQPYDMPSPEADALDRIAEAYLGDLTCEEALSAIGFVLLETGRAL